MVYFIYADCISCTHHPPGSLWLRFTTSHFQPERVPKPSFVDDSCPSLSLLLPSCSATSPTRKLVSCLRHRSRVGCVTTLLVLPWKGCQTSSLVVPVGYANAGSVKKKPRLWQAFFLPFQFHLSIPVIKDPRRQSTSSRWPVHCPLSTASTAQHPLRALQPLARPNFNPSPLDSTQLFCPL